MADSGDGQAGKAVSDGIAGDCGSLAPDFEASGIKWKQ